MNGGVATHIIIVLAVILGGYLVNSAIGSGYHHISAPCGKPEETGCFILHSPVDPPTHKKCTQLWIYTNPVEKGPCVSFKHPSYSTMMKESANNTIFNSGITAAYKAIHQEGKSRTAPCPETDRNWCLGWKYGMANNS